MPDRDTMSKRFIRLTSGWIPASVMLLFATALVMGQDRPVPQQENVPVAAPGATVFAPELLDANDAGTDTRQPGGASVNWGDTS